MLRATIKLAGRPANRRIFLAFTTNHVATENARYLSALFLSQQPQLPLFTARIFLARERKLHGDFAMLRRSKRRKTTAPVPTIPPV